jgi:putative colanic acid biosynthesis acetyltransferase WcaF
LKTDLNTYNNRGYSSGNLFARFIWYFFNAIFFKSNLFPSYSLKRAILKLFGAEIGTDVIVKPNVNIKYPWKLKVGHYVWIGEGVWIDNLDFVYLGSHSCISQGALLFCGNHDYSKSSFDLIVRPIVLEDGVWIGAKSIVCPGVVIGSHGVLSTGSVLSDDIKPYEIYRGNPAKKIKSRTIK